MKRKSVVTLNTAASVLLTAVTVLFSAASALAGGPLLPPGPPGPTMVSLSQIEPRTPISQSMVPYTITQPGAYYLTENLAVNSGDAIDIQSSDVTLDLKGFTISSTAASPNGTAIQILGFAQNISIYNGNISGTVNYVNGSFSGAGFAYGVHNQNLVVSVRVSALGVSGVLDDGINLMAGGSDTAVESCTVYAAGGVGIGADSVANSVAFVCGNYGIVGFDVLNSAGSSENGTSIFASGAAQNCYAYSAGNAPGLSAGMAENSYGFSSGGTGLGANTALNCQGYSIGGNGLSVNNGAENCTGYSVSNIGLYSFGTATGCNGQSGGVGTGLSASTAENSYGSSASGTGLSAEFGALNCYGLSTGNGTGLIAVNAENCYGISESNGWGLNVQTATGCTGISQGYGWGLTANTAINCYGSATSDYGLYAFQSAENCYGQSTVGVALVAYSALNSAGVSDGSIGLYAEMAENCWGQSLNSTGLRADVGAVNSFGQTFGEGADAVFTANGNFCFDVFGESSDVVVTGNKYNMP